MTIKQNSTKIERETHFGCFYAKNSLHPTRIQNYFNNLTRPEKFNYLLAIFNMIDGARKAGKRKPLV